MLAKADPKKGEQIAKVCAACHTFNKGGPNKIGPNLWDITEEAMAEVPGYQFSAAMEAHKGEKWDPEKLNEWLWKPQAFDQGHQDDLCRHPQGAGPRRCHRLSRDTEIGLPVPPHELDRLS